MCLREMVLSKDHELNQGTVMSKVVKEVVDWDADRLVGPVISDELRETLEDFYFVDYLETSAEGRRRRVRIPYVHTFELPKQLMNLKVGIVEGWVRDVRIQQMSDLSDPMNSEYQTKVVCDHLGKEFVPSHQKIEMMFGSVYKITQSRFDKRSLYRC